MNSRLFRSLVAGSLTASLLLAVAAHAGATSTAGDTDDSISPVSTKVSAIATNFTAKGSINGIAITVKCTSSTFSGKTPATGLTVTIAPPVFRGCTDSLSPTDIDTVTTNQTNGKWKLTFVDAANDETTEGPDSIKLTVPKAGSTFSSSFLPSCVITIAPTGPASVTSSYDDVNKATLTKQVIATHGSGCASSSAKLSATYTLTPGIHDVS